MEIINIDEKRKINQRKYNKTFRSKLSEEDHKKVLEYAKDYNDANREKRLLYNKEKFYCEFCNSNTLKCQRSSHLKCKKHLKNVERVQSIINIDISTNDILCDAA
jgi:hypothetical protein